MRIGVVFCHPMHDSLAGELLRRIVAGATRGGHEVRVIDLYAEQFVPELSADERRAQFLDHDEHPDARPGIERHVEFLRWCDTLVLAYPTWWGSQPAMLKGWFDRVWVTGVAYLPPKPGTNRIRAHLRNIRRIVVVTTHGSPKWLNALQGEGGKRTITRSLRTMCHPLARTQWLALYGVDRASDTVCRRFADRVERWFAELGTPRRQRTKRATTST